MIGVLGHAQHDAEVTLAAWLPALLLATALIVSYLFAAARITRRTLRAWPRTRTAAFVSGSATIALGASPPVHAFAAGDLRGHVLQHLLLGMYAPVALVLAAPMTLLLAALPTKAARTLTSVLRRRPTRVLTHPAAAGLVTIAGMYALYFTPLYAATAHDTVLGYGLHIHFLLTGCVFAWSIAGRDPAPSRPGLRTRIAALVGVAGAHAYLAKTLYAQAATSPPGAGHDPDEVRQAAQLMYYGGDVAELVITIALLTASLRARRRKRPRPAVRGTPLPRRVRSRAVVSGHAELPEDGHGCAHTWHRVMAATGQPDHACHRSSAMTLDAPPPRTGRPLTRSVQPAGRVRDRRCDVVVETVTGVPSRARNPRL